MNVRMLVSTVLGFLVLSLHVNCLAYRITITNLSPPWPFFATVSKGANRIAVKLPEFSGAVVEVPENIDKLEVSAILPDDWGAVAGKKIYVAGIFEGANIPPSGSELYIVPQGNISRLAPQVVPDRAKVVYKKDLDAALRAWTIENLGAQYDRYVKYMKRIEDWRAMTGMRRLFVPALYDFSVSKSLNQVRELANQKVG